MVLLFLLTDSAALRDFLIEITEDIFPTFHIQNSCKQGLSIGERLEQKPELTQAAHIRKCVS